MGPHIAALRTEFSERAAGLYFEHEPEYKLVVRLVGTAPMPPRKLHIDGVDVPVEFRTGAAARLDDLVHAIGRNLDHLKELLPELQGVGTDEQTGEIVLNILAVGSNREAVAAERNAISRLVGFPVRIDFQDVAERSADIRGGARITSPSSYCTSGFVVKNSSGTNAVSTAAHCEGINTYHNPDGTTHPLNTAISEFLDADQDVEVHTSSATERPEFYADSTATARTLTGRRLRSSTAAGDPVCHRGATTGYSCGTVQQTNYAPTYAGACGSVACSAVFVKVAGGATTKCYGGDSGGPVFASQTAFGLLKSAAATGSSAGQCSYFTYMSTDYLPTGWTLLYGP